jgi:hypothetical protein
MKEDQKIKMEGGLLNTACILPMNVPHATITYLDHAVDMSPQPYIEGEIPLQTLSISSFATFVKAESHQCSATLRKSLVADIQHLHGIDAIRMSSDALKDEMHAGIQKRLYEKYTSLGSVNRESKKTKWRKWVEKTFKVQLPEYTEKPVSTILKISNQIVADSRRGPAQFVIVSPKTLSEIQKDPRFLYVIQSEDHHFPIAGQIPGMNVYVNAGGHHESNQVVIGRKTSNAGDPGVYYCEYSNDINSYEDPISMDTKIQLLSRHAIKEVGQTPYSLYYTEDMIVGKKPLWRKLFRL